MMTLWEQGEGGFICLYIYLGEGVFFRRWGDGGWRSRGG
uniref:Ethylene-responsive transcription factor n=1 Tax=Rhizophora mucronata TaxID=61149 RepID=A0A2P2JFR2_RHIMU